MPSVAFLAPRSLVGARLLFRAFPATRLSRTSSPFPHILSATSWRALPSSYQLLAKSPSCVVLKSTKPLSMDSDLMDDSAFSLDDESDGYVPITVRLSVVPNAAPSSRRSLLSRPFASPLLFFAVAFASSWRQSSGQR